MCSSSMRTCFAKSRRSSVQPCSENWTEGQARTVRLPDAVPSDFQIYIDRLYTPRLRPAHVLNASTESSIPKYPATRRRLHRGLIGLWQLGDYSGDLDFQRSAMNDLLHFGRHGPMLDQAYLLDLLDEIPSGSGLYCWLVDHVAAFVKPLELDDLQDSLSTDFVYDVLRRTMSLLRSKSLVTNPDEREKCYDKPESEEAVKASVHRTTVVASKK